MFFRDKKSPSGQVLQLLEAFRDEENRARNRVVISLGAAQIAAADRPAGERSIRVAGRKSRRRQTRAAHAAPMKTRLAPPRSRGR